MESSTGAGQDDEAEWRGNVSFEDYFNHSLVDSSESLYDVPASLIVLLSILYGTISVLAVVGNFLVMWVVATSRRMQSVTNCFISNLALADIVIGLFAVPFQFQAALLQRWLLPHFMCAFCPFVQALSVNVSVFTLTAIAVDRHRAIITPLSAHTSKRVAKVMIVLIWVLALALAAPMAMSWEVIMVDEEDSDDSESLSNRKKPFCAPSEFGSNSLAIYRLILYVCQYIIPLCVISCAYVHMAMKLWGTHAPGNAQAIRDAQQMKNKKRVIKMLVLVVALFALCWLPLQSYLLLQSFFPSINEYRYINVIFFCFDWLAMSNSCYNPFIYAIYNEKFKKEFKQRFSFGKNHNRYLNDSFENGHSYRTRTLSFRSTTDRDISNRFKSFRSKQNESIKITRNSCYLPRDRNKHEDDGGGTTEKKPKFLNIDSRGRNYRKNNNEPIVLCDEKATELYIFPHSQVVDFIDTPSYDDKV